MYAGNVEGYRYVIIIEYGAHAGNVEEHKYVVIPRENLYVNYATVVKYANTIK